MPITINISVTKLAEKPKFTKKYVNIGEKIDEKK